MTTQLQLRRGTDAENNAFTGAEGEVTVDTTNKTLRVHDGVTQGGFAVAHESDTAKNDMSNLTNVGENIANWSSNVTNCITEIPQDINLTFSAGTLTLKAGSKLFIPNGVGVFDTYTLTTDKTLTSANNGGNFVWFNTNTNLLRSFPISLCSSGSTAPSGYTYMLWYDTTNNAIKITEDGGNTWTDGQSLPIGIMTGNASNQIVSLDRIFNGFGYIGSTVFALPGVKGLIPDGRNTDGTLKNTTFALSSVKTYTNTNAVTNTTGRIYADGTMLWSAVSDIYNPDTNYNMAGTTIDNACVFAYITSTTGGQITSFNPKIAFHAVDYNDSDYIANCAMPSSKYVDLTLGASWASYTMPADGYLFLDMSATAVNQYVKILNNTSGVGTSMTTQTNGFNLYIFLPVSKGDNVSVAYGSDLTKNKFRFIYANGAK